MWHVVKLPELITVFSDEDPAITKADYDSRNKGDDLYVFVNNDILADIKSNSPTQ